MEMTDQRRNPFAITVALAALRTPGEPPPGWVGQVATIGAFWFVSTIVIVSLAVIVHEEPAYYFGEHRLGTFVSFAMFVAAALASWRVSRRLANEAFSRLWRFGAVGLTFLGCDDYFMFHENIDWGIHWLLGWDPKDPGTDRIDDLIVISYPVVAGAVAWPWRHELATLSWMRWALVAAMSLFSAMAALDWLRGSMVIEESLKIAAEGAILAAILAAEGSIANRFAAAPSQWA